MSKRRSATIPRKKSRSRVVCGHFRTHVTVVHTPSTDTAWGAGSWLVTHCTNAKCRAYLGHEPLPEGYRTPSDIINEYRQRMHNPKVVK